MVSGSCAEPGGDLSQVEWTAPFLGITAHYFQAMVTMHHTIALAVRHLSLPHIAERISDTINDILLEWKLSKQQIF